jgi:glutamine synthetase
MSVQTQTGPAALDRREVAKKMYQYIEKKALDAYNSGEDEFFIGYMMIVRDLNFETSPDNTFAFMDDEGGEDYDISFFDEPVAAFIYKVGRLLMKKHGDKIRALEMRNDILYIFFA